MTAGSRSPPPSAGSDPPIAYRSGLLPSPAAAAATRPPLQLLSAAATSVAGMRALLPLLLLLLAVCTAPRACGGWTDGAADAARGAEGKARVISRIAFGSCANQSTPQPIWDAINDFDPQLFIWLGDNIYGDNKRPFRVFGKERTIGPWKNVPRFFPASEQELTERYQLQKNNKGYSALRTRAQVIGTWDDHDYGLNDAGKEFMGKNMTQRLMLDFLDEALDSPRRTQAGVYASYLFGPKGKQIKVILLDTRYHRDPISSDGSILGETQWAWLDEELHGPASEITIIGSSIQVISNLSATTGPLFYMECWGRFPKERDRLYKLIDKSKRNGVFFISGDVHFAEITRCGCATGYPLYDVTSSGLTQAVEKAVPSLDFLVRLAAWLTPTTMRVYNSKCRYKSCTYGRPNFGAIEINWDVTPQTLRLEMRDLHGGPVTGVSILLSDLHNSHLVNSTRETVEKYQDNCILEISLPWIVRHRLAILFYLFIAVLITVLMAFIYITISVSKRFALKFKMD